MNDKVMEGFDSLLKELADQKEKAATPEAKRAVAVTITEVEKAFAYFSFWAEPLL